MLSVFICEDNQPYREMLLDCIEKFIAIKNFDMEVSLCTHNPAEILNHIGKNVNGLYFLDVEIANLVTGDVVNGVELAQAIRERDPRGFIVFITAHPRYISLTFEYKVEALAYIHKAEGENVRNKIHDCIENAYNKHVSRADEGYFIFQARYGLLVSCGYDDILFFETQSSNRIILHARKRQYKFYSTLEKIIKELPFGLFFHCHKSYIINVSNLTEKAVFDLRRGNDRIIMPNGSACLVSSRKKSGLIKLLETIPNF
ncbi:MAG: LytTR family DNA-binding domain-containing protein [Defluviitaleaceae bacterium]|nr:LytTR family DNA-binding domain-containing protein [Defluviitaleaceae bacterium]